MMNFEVRVVEPNDFKAYLQQRIDGKTNAQALQAIGEEPSATTTQAVTVTYEVEYQQ